MENMSKIKTNKLSLSVQYASKAKKLPTRSQLRQWLKTAQLRDLKINLRLVDEPEGRELNKKFRGKDYATNVLTFVYDDLKTGVALTSEAKHTIYGDVVICVPVVEHEAVIHQKELLAHYAHLSIHAALHLQGYDHEMESDAKEMETLETSLMLKLNFTDPYQS